MIFIDPEEIEQSTPGELKQRLLEATAELRALPEEERAAYIRRKDSLWKDVRPYLAAVTGRAHSQHDFKCWYCEEKAARFTYHVDHFRPKGRVKDKGRDPEPGYWWLAFDYRNYRLSCEFCNSPHTDEDDEETRGKWDQFPLSEGSTRADGPNANTDDEIRLLIDPSRSSEVIHLTFDDEGRTRPLHEEGYLYDMADRTINVLNLNHQRIVDARRQIRENCLRLVRDGDEEYEKWRRGGSPAAASAFRRVCEQIREMVQPWSEFSAMARACFRGTGKEWLLPLLM
jgi:uncharacterized protein (TIGR02646 family)